MLKINRRLVLLLILVIAMAISVGCSKSQKAPEGISQEFYDDMIEVLKKLEKTKGEIDTDNGEDIIKEYRENETWLAIKEKDILNDIEDLHFWVWFYNNKESESDLKDELMIRDKLRRVSTLMDLEIEENKFKK